MSGSAGPKADPEQLRSPNAEPPDRVVPALWMEPRVKQHAPLGMLDQEHRYRHRDVALTAFHQAREVASYRAAGEGEEPGSHNNPWF